jgi:hypothetical protein
VARKSKVLRTPRTADLLRGRGLRVVTVPITEFEKLEGCVTCLSVRLRRVAGDSVVGVPRQDEECQISLLAPGTEEHLSSALTLDEPRVSSSGESDLFGKLNS